MNRGYTLAIVLASLALVGTAAEVARGQVLAHRLSSRAEERRMQALWLARSAAQSPKPVRAEVTVGGEVAHVESGHQRARASFASHGAATVTGAEERYERLAR